MTQKLVKLKNGSEELETAVVIVMASLQGLVDKDPIIAYELVMKARDRNHQLFGVSGEVLRNCH